MSSTQDDFVPGLVRGLRAAVLVFLFTQEYTAIPWRDDGTATAVLVSSYSVLVYPSTRYLVFQCTILVFSFFFSWSSFLLSSSTRINRRFYPQRSSGQAVVTGVVPSPPPVRAFISIALCGLSITMNFNFPFPTPSILSFTH